MSRPIRVYLLDRDSKKVDYRIIWKIDWEMDMKLPMAL